jgi:hypothetical protein
MDYVSCYAGEAGFETQVLVVDLPVDFVKDPDLESSYRKVNRN